MSSFVCGKLFFSNSILSRSLSINITSICWNNLSPIASLKWSYVNCIISFVSFFTKENATGNPFNLEFCATKENNTYLSLLVQCVLSKCKTSIYFEIHSFWHANIMKILSIIPWSFVLTSTVLFGSSFSSLISLASSSCWSLLS